MLIVLLSLSQCDESLPRCRVCSTRGLQCQYTAPHAVVNPAATSLPIKLPFNCAIPATDKALQTAVPDALLWQYYLLHASKTVTASSVDPAHTRMWEKSIPAIAFSSAVVSHAMLAFSAFCLCTSPSLTKEKGENRELLAAAERHYYQSVKLLRLSLAAVEDIDADVVLACGIVLIPCGLALVCRDDGSVSPLQDWLYHLRGWRPIGASIYGPSGQLNAASTKLIPYPQPGIPESKGLPARRAEGNERWPSSVPFLRKIRRSWLEAMARLKNEIDSHCNQGMASADFQTMYISAITALERVMDYILTYPVTNLFRAVFIWPIQVPPEFIQLLADHDGLALAIYAHWLVLTMTLEDLWWLTGFGSGQIEGIIERVVSLGGFGSGLLAWLVEMLDEWRCFGRTGRIGI
jgi:hypothetical protein